MSKGPRYGSKQLPIVEQMRTGSTLWRYFEQGREVWVLDGAGEQDSDPIRRLQVRGVLRERQDGMFGVGMSFELNEDGAGTSEVVT